VSTLRFIDAIRNGLDIEMRRDPSVVVLGEDVTYGGPFGATKGLAEAHGSRIRDTPISEATVVGLAVGAAVSGLRPVVEIMYIDFITLAMDQLVNHGAKLRYMTNGLLRAPMVIRAQGGARGSMGAHHSQSLEAWFGHLPGMTVVAPSTPADAQGLLQAAIRSDDPVLYLEHRGLYWQKGEVPDEDDRVVVPIGKAIVRRPGSDLTIVSWSHMMGAALDAADGLAGDGIEAEVIDLRSLLPFDMDTLLASVGRTGRLVVAHEAVTRGGMGAEIAAQVQERAWAELAAPVARVGAPFVPPPFAPELERAFVRDADAIIAAARHVLDTPARGGTPTPSPEPVEA